MTAAMAAKTLRTAKMAAKAKLAVGRALKRHQGRGAAISSPPPRKIRVP
ncbi:hypothetical protein [Agreia bicolorata]|nr:hypothetical protein [Agreia bicolorata]